MMSAVSPASDFISWSSPSSRRPLRLRRSAHRHHSPRSLLLIPRVRRGSAGRSRDADGSDRLAQIGRSLPGRAPLLRRAVSTEILTPSSRSPPGTMPRHHRSWHTFATDVLDATEGDLYAVKELLGHSSTRVTEVHLHSSRTRTLLRWRRWPSTAVQTVKPMMTRNPYKREVSRRRADSNRCTRLCRPLPNHSATAPGQAIVAVLLAA